MLQINFRASKSSPCPVLNCDHSCSATADGLHFCHHGKGPVVGWRYFGQTKCGTWGMYRREGDITVPQAKQSNGANGTNGTPSKHLPTPTKEAKEEVPVEALRAKTEKIRQKFAEWRSQTPEQMQEEADLLGLPRWVLDLFDCCHFMRCGKDLTPGLATLELNGDGMAVGKNRRLRNGEKKQCRGDGRGLIYRTDDRGIGLVEFVPEGFSDTATLEAMGLHATGRPSNTGGTHFLVQRFRRPEFADTQIIILGENDQKPDGLWPGKDGAECVARSLARQLDQMILVAFPPDGFKDVREWFKYAKPENLNDIAALQALSEEFLSLVLPNAVAVYPPGKAPEVRVPVLRAVPPPDNAPPEKSGGSCGSDCGCDSPSDSDSDSDSVDLRQFDENFRPRPHNRPNGGRAKGCGVIMRFRDRDIGTFVDMRVVCGRWSCVPCAKKLKSTWTNHLANKILPLEKVYIWQGPAEQWDKVRKHISRQKGEYCRIKHPDGTMFVVTTAFHEDFRELKSKDGFWETQGSIYDLPPCERPISTSRGWRLEEEEDDDDRTGPKRSLEVIGAVGNHNLEMHLRIFKAFGIASDLWKSPPKKVEWVVEFAPPDEGTLRQLNYYLMLGEPPPSHLPRSG